MLSIFVSMIVAVVEDLLKQMRIVLRSLLYMSHRVCQSNGFIFNSDLTNAARHV